jgi:hypothetical protein
MNPENPNSSIDALGLGSIAKAIPPEVYMRTAESILSAFDSLVAPITRSTAGLGELIRQKFENMTQREKALAEYSLRRALEKAETKSKALHDARGPVHFKSIIRALEEVSKETDPVLHEMWTNLLASEFTNGSAHPHFIQILTHFSSAEAHLLVTLRDIKSAGYKGDRGILVGKFRGAKWVRNSDDTESFDWNLACSLLVEFGVADVLAAKTKEKGGPCLLFRTSLGTDFLKVVQD